MVVVVLLLVLVWVAVAVVLHDYMPGNIHACNNNVVRLRDVI